jgi:hypothetical protein
LITKPPEPLATLDKLTAFVLSGQSQSGRSVSSAGDVNGDGLDDLVIGAFGADPIGKNNAGKVFVVFGKKGVCITSFNNQII